jgi:hypothetical protein
MRRSLLLLVLAAIGVAGCGSSASPPTGSGARDAELSYFPSSSPLVLSLATDPNATPVKQGQALLGLFPVAALGQTALTVELQKLGIDYQTGVRPLFGNPIMVGGTAATLSGPTSSQYLLVWVTKDASRLAALVKKLPGFHSVGSHDGATLYRGSGSVTLALDGATALLGPSQAALASALDRHAHGGGITSGDYERAIAGLPRNPLFQVFGNLTGVLSASQAATARRVPWVAALRGYAASISAGSSSLTFQYRLDTGGVALTSAQVPIAPGTTAPSFAGTLPITAAISDPAHVVAFAEAAAQAASPGSYASFLKRDAAVKAKTGVDLNSLLGLLTGNLILASDTHMTMVRATVSDPGAAARDLSKLLTAPRSVLGQASTTSDLGGGFYAIKQRKITITVGVAGDQLVAGRASVAQLRAFGAAPTTAVPDARGSVAFRIALLALLRIAIKRPPAAIVQQLLGLLGDVTGSTSASTKSLTGSATLGLK